MTPELSHALTNLVDLIAFIGIMGFLWLCIRSF